MTGTDVARITHKQSRSYLNHLVRVLVLTVFCIVCAVFLYCFVCVVYIYSYLFCLYLCNYYCHQVTTQLQ